MAFPAPEAQSTRATGTFRQNSGCDRVDSPLCFAVLGLNGCGGHVESIRSMYGGEKHIDLDGGKHGGEC